MNYYEIGQRIRKYRKAYNMSQEQLAEQIGISTTHMSHIETGNTKLSLPVLVDIARVLSVQTDDLLFDCPQVNKSSMKLEIANFLDSCTPQEVCVINEMMQTLKLSLEKYYK